MLVFELIGSGLKVAGTVAFDRAGPAAGVLAGALVDRHPRRRVMVMADLGRAAVALALAAFGDHLAVVYAAAFGLSAGPVFFNPAASSLLPSVVHPEDLVEANSALWSAAVISQIALAPLAGALVAFAGAGPAFLLNAASFLVSAVLLGGMAVPPHPARVPRRRWPTCRRGFGSSAVAVFSYLLRGGVDITLAATTNFGVAMGALGVYGVGTSTGMVTYNSVLQSTLPDRIRGRIFAFYDVVWQGSRLVSIAGGGILATPSASGRCTCWAGCCSSPPGAWGWLGCAVRISPRQPMTPVPPLEQARSRGPGRNRNRQLRW